MGERKVSRRERGGKKTSTPKWLHPFSCGPYFLLFVYILYTQTNTIRLSNQEVHLRAHGVIVCEMIDPSLVNQILSKLNVGSVVVVVV